MDQLKPEYLLIIGIIAPWIAQGIKFIAAKSGKEVDRKPITVGLFVFSMLLAYAWMKPTRPELPPISDDPAAFAASILNFVAGVIASAASVTGFATTIYNLLYQQVFEKLNIGKDRIQGVIDQYHLSSNIPF